LLKSDDELGYRRGGQELVLSDGTGVTSSVIEEKRARVSAVSWDWSHIKLIKMHKSCKFGH
jgi:hypothetical protein